MKKLLILIIIFPIVISSHLSGCVSHSKTRKSQTIAKEKKQPEQDFSKISPGTCALLLNNIKAHTRDENHFITGEIQKIIGYGAGFTTTFEIKQIIKLQITRKQAQTIHKEKKQTYTIREEIHMGETTPTFRLIRTNNH